MRAFVRRTCFRAALAAPERGRRALAAVLVIDLGFFGVAVDWIHSATIVWWPDAYRPFGILEDGGESLALTAGLALTLCAWAGRRGAEAGAPGQSPNTSSPSPRPLGVSWRVRSPAARS